MKIQKTLFGCRENKKFNLLKLRKIKQGRVSLTELTINQRKQMEVENLRIEKFSRETDRK